MISHKLEMYIPGKVSEGYFVPKAESFKSRIFTPKNPFSLKSAKITGVWWLAGELSLGTLIQVRTNHIIVKELHIGERVLLDEGIAAYDFELEDPYSGFNGFSFYLWGGATNPTIQIRFEKLKSRSLSYIKDLSCRYSMGCETGEKNE